MAEIDANTVIDRGMQLSKNFLLEHVSSGAYHPIMAQWVPKFSAILNPRAGSNALNMMTSDGMPLWKIVNSLQAGAEGMLENLLNGFGGDLIIQSGFLNKIPKNALPNEIQHLLGTSFDIQIKGYEDNMYGVAKEIQKLTKTASELNLVFGSTSWVHIGVDPQKVKTPSYYLKELEFKTSDLITGITETGLTSIRGFI